MSAYDLTGISYDRQGNLLTLNRRNEAGTRVDSLLYVYQAGRNRLASLTERAGVSSATWDAEAGAFTYDKNGNVLTLAAPWNVSATVYDARNLPVSVSVTVGNTTEQSLPYPTWLTFRTLFLPIPFFAMGGDKLTQSIRL